MRTAREQEALTIRAQGAKQAQIIRAEADADASRIYAESFGQDPDFYDFYRAMQSYRQTFSPQAKGGASVILSQDNSYLNARSEEHTSALQSLMRISYAVFCLTTQTTYTPAHIV